MSKAYAAYERRIPIGYDKVDNVQVGGIDFISTFGKNILSLLESSSTKPYKDYPFAFKIDTLVSLELRKAIDFFIERDDGGFIAKSPNFPLYGFGDDIYEAIEMLKVEIETLYFDLNEDDKITDSWISIKALLNSIIE